MKRYARCIVGGLLIGVLLAVLITEASATKKKEKKETPKPDVTYEECAARTKVVADAYYKEHPADRARAGQLETESDYIFDSYLRTVKYDSTGCYEWKDPASAARMNKTLKEYVVDGMIPELRKKLHALFRALKEAGFNPGIASGYRDEYRQSLITSGVHAGANKSFHNGSREDHRKRGWGLGQAVDIVNISSDDFTEDERKTVNEVLWRFVDEHPGYGIGRPYGAGDPGHVALIGGEECELTNCLRRTGHEENYAESMRKALEEHARKIVEEQLVGQSVGKESAKPEEKRIEKPKEIVKRHRKHQKHKDMTVPYEYPPVQTY